MSLHEKVSGLCKKKGITIYKMCKDIGLAQNAVTNWKNRPEAEPQLSTALKMAKYFDVKIEYFALGGK